MSKRATRSSKLRAELERLSGHDLVLSEMFDRGALTAERYIEMNWGELPPEIDPEEQHIIDVLKEYEKVA